MFTARERYAEAPRSLRALFERAGVPFRLLIVDAATPKRYRRGMEEAVRGRRGVEFLSHDGYLLPNRARNLAAEAVREPFVLFLENDCRLRPGCVERLLAEARMSSGVAVPWIWEHGKGHFDLRTGTATELASGELFIEPARGFPSPPSTRERLEFFENHAFLMPRAAIEAAGPFDDELNSRELVDYSLCVRRAGVPVFLVPGAEVDFYPPPPIRWDELAHYRLRWDLHRVERSNERVRSRWRIVNMPSSRRFAWRQHLRVSHLAWGGWRLRLAIERWWASLHRSVARR